MVVCQQRTQTEAISWYQWIYVYSVAVVFCGAFYHPWSSYMNAVFVWLVFSSSSESSAETDNEQAQDNTRNATFSNKTSNSIWSVVGSAPSSGEAQHSVGSEGSALPLPAWLDASSQDSSAADARVQSIRDIIRVGKLIFVFFRISCSYNLFAFECILLFGVCF